LFRQPGSEIPAQRLRLCFGGLKSSVSDELLEAVDKLFGAKVAELG
jgi:hypothetical protein